MRTVASSGRRGWRVPASWWVSERSAAGTAVLVVACLAGAAVAPGTAASVSASASAGRAVVSALRWHRCPPGSAAAIAGFVCATAAVPLDYRHPQGPQIRLAVVKHPATGPGRRLGTLFVNPGGPGELGTVDIPAYFGLIPAVLAQRFDVVSWDPRGVGQSTAVQCFPSAAAEAKFLGPSALFPVGRAAQRAYIRKWAGVGLRCALRNRVLLDHVSTADTARDLNLLRQAVGDPVMNYLGESYGTYLGATYANLFPGTIRAMVLDGNVAPTLWANNNNPHARLTVQQRVGSDVGAATTLGAFLALCGRAATKDCAFSAGTPAKTRAKFTALLARLRTGPITITLGGQKVTFTYPLLLTELVSLLQITRPIISPIPSDSLPGWPQDAALLQVLWAARGGRPAAAPAMPGIGGTAGSRYAGTEQNLAIKCESPSPAVWRFPTLAAREPARAGPIGQVNLWLDEPCATWLAHPAGLYRGPWNKPTAAPILLVGNTTDPATPYASSVLMAAELANAQLLTLHGYGHTASRNPSTCVNDAEVAYFLHGTLPPKGTICQQNTAPFASGP